MSSLNGFSQKLEKRRQAARDKKEAKASKEEQTKSTDQEEKVA